MTNNSDVNFQGGFWIKHPKHSKWEVTKKILPRGNIVFEQIFNEGDKFIATKNCYDKHITYTLMRQNLDFVFFPGISLKNRLDSRYPKEAEKIINSQKQFLTLRDEIRNYFANSPLMSKLISDYRWKPNDQVYQTLKFLNLSKEDCTVKIEKGITIISDKSGKVIAKASPNNFSGQNFVYILPRHSEDMSQMLCLNYKGEKQGRYAPDEFMIFHRQFMRNVKIGLGRKLPEK